jgi:hypothetical protein
LVSTSASGSFVAARSISQHDLTTGSYYLEFTINGFVAGTTYAVAVGLGTTLTDSNGFTNSDNIYLWDAATVGQGVPNATVNNIFYPGTFSFTAGTNVVGMAIKNGFVWFRVNNLGWIGASATGTGADPVAGTGGIAFNNGAVNFAAMVSKNLTVAVNTVAPFVHAAPTGFGTWGGVVPSPVPVSWDPTSAFGWGMPTQGFLDSDNMRMVTTTTVNGATARSMTPADLTNGRYYFEYTLNDPSLSLQGTVSAGTSPGGSTHVFGPSNEMTGIGFISGYLSLAGSFDLVMYDDGKCYVGGSVVASLPIAFAPGNCNIGMAVGGGKFWVRINGGPWNGSTSADPVAGTGGVALPSTNIQRYFVGYIGYWPTYGVATLAVNTAGPFVYAPPTGYRTWPNPPMQGDGFDTVTIAGPPVSFQNDNQGFIVDPIASPNVGYSFVRSTSAVQNDLTGAANSLGAKIYLEFTINDYNAPNWWMQVVGVGNVVPMRQGAYAGTFPDQIVLASDGTVWGNNAQIADLGPPSGGHGEVTGIAIYAGKIWFRRNNGPWNGNAANSPVNNTGGLTIPAGAKHYIMSAIQLSTSVNTAGPLHILLLVALEFGHQLLLICLSPTLLAST